MASEVEGLSSPGRNCGWQEVANVVYGRSRVRSRSMRSGLCQSSLAPPQRHYGMSDLVIRSTPNLLCLSPRRAISSPRALAHPSLIPFRRVARERDPASGLTPNEPPQDTSPLQQMRHSPLQSGSSKSRLGSHRGLADVQEYLVRRLVLLFFGGRVARWARPTPGARRARTR